MRTLGKRVMGQTIQGFESPSLRHFTSGIDPLIVWLNPKTIKRFSTEQDQLRHQSISNPHNSILLKQGSDSSSLVQAQI